MTEVDTDDRRLLLAMHRGHEASARLLWQRRAPGLLAYARAILRTPGAAEDVVQTVICRLLQEPRARLAAIHDVPAFLTAAVRREALNSLRAARREAARRAHPRPTRDASATPGISNDLAAALDALPRRLREVVVLRHAADLTFEQIALALHTTRKTVASRYHDALALLKTRLDPHPAPQGVSRA